MSVDEEQEMGDSNYFTTSPQQLDTSTSCSAALQPTTAANEQEMGDSNYFTTSPQQLDTSTSCSAALQPTTAANEQETSEEHYTKKEKRKKERKYTYKCKYCSKEFEQLRRHYEQKHSKEIEVIELMNLGKKESFFFFKKMRNSTVLMERRKTSPDPTLVACISCNVTVKKENSLKHIKSCKLAIEEEITKRDCIREEFFSKYSTALSIILARMKSDEIGEIMRKDKLIMDYAEYLVASQVGNLFVHISASFFMNLREGGPFFFTFI